MFSFTIGDREDSERVTCFSLFADNTHIVVCYNNGIIKQFRLHDTSATMICQFRSTHTGPILLSILSADSQLLFTGSSDFSVKIWNLAERTCSHTLKGPSVVSALCLVGTSTFIVGYSEGQLRFHDLSRKGLSPKDLDVHSRYVLLLFSLEINSIFLVGLLQFWPMDMIRTLFMFCHATRQCRFWMFKRSRHVEFFLFMNRLKRPFMSRVVDKL